MSFVSVTQYRDRTVRTTSQPAMRWVPPATLTVWVSNSLSRLSSLSQGRTLTHRAWRRGPRSTRLGSRIPTRCNGLFIRDLNIADTNVYFQTLWLRINYLLTGFLTKTEVLDVQGSKTISSTVMCLSELSLVTITICKRWCLNYDPTSFYHCFRPNNDWSFKHFDVLSRKTVLKKASTLFIVFKPISKRVCTFI